jgi:hypothetical protein
MRKDYNSTTFVMALFCSLAIGLSACGNKPPVKPKVSEQKKDETPPATPTAADGTGDPAAKKVAETKSDAERLAETKKAEEEKAKKLADAEAAKKAEEEAKKLAEEKAAEAKAAEDAKAADAAEKAKAAEAAKKAAEAAKAEADKKAAEAAKVDPNGLAAQLIELQKISTDACDLQNAKENLEIVKALDSNRAAINLAVIENFHTEVNDKKVDIGSDKIILRDAKTSSQFGLEKEASWAGVRSFYEKLLKGKKFDDTTKASWLKLDRQVDLVLTRDQNRLQDQMNLQLRWSMKEAVTQLRSEIEACKTNEECYEFSDTYFKESHELVSKNDIYLKHVDLLNQEKDKPTFRVKLQAFLDRVNKDLNDRWTFNVNSAVSLDSDKKTLSVRLNSEKFSDNEQKDLESIVASIIKQESLPIKLIWDNVGTEPRAELSFVNYDTSRELARKFGMLIGLRKYNDDTYAPESCSYTIRPDESNIMSVPVSGSITTDHVKEIIEAYNCKK